MLRLNLNGSYLCARDNFVRSEGAHPVSFTVNYITALPVGWLTVRRALAWWPCCACAGGWSQARCSASIVFLLLWRGNEKVKDRLSNREGILLHPLHLLPVPLTVLSDRNDRARMIHMCRFSLVNPRIAISSIHKQMTLMNLFFSNLSNQHTFLNGFVVFIKRIYF